MTSTLDGLQALVSSTGYQHCDKRSVAMNSRRGCPLCSLIRRDARSSWRSVERLSLFSRARDATALQSDYFDDPVIHGRQRRRRRIEVGERVNVSEEWFGCAEANFRFTFESLVMS